MALKEDPVTNSLHGAWRGLCSVTISRQTCNVDAHFTGVAMQLIFSGCNPVYLEMPEVQTAVFRFSELVYYYDVKICLVVLIFYPCVCKRSCQLPPFGLYTLHISLFKLNTCPSKCFSQANMKNVFRLLCTLVN